MSKNRIACLIMCLLMLMSCIWLCGCSEADKVNANISKQADYFETERRITVYTSELGWQPSPGLGRCEQTDVNNPVCSQERIHDQHAFKMCSARSIRGFTSLL